MPRYNVTIVFDNKEKEELHNVGVEFEEDTLILNLEGNKKVVVNWDKVTYYILEELER